MSNKRIFLNFHNNLLVELEEGEHFWGRYVSKIDNDLKVFGVINGEIYVCGAWEGSIPSNDIDFVTRIPKPWK